MHDGCAINNRYAAIDAVQRGLFGHAVAYADLYPEEFELKKNTYKPKEGISHHNETSAQLNKPNIRKMVAWVLGSAVWDIAREGNSGNIKVRGADGKEVSSVAEMAVYLVGKYDREVIQRAKLLRSIDVIGNRERLLHDELSTAGFLFMMPPIGPSDKEQSSRIRSRL